LSRLFVLGVDLVEVGKEEVEYEEEREEKIVSFLDFSPYEES